MKTAFITILYLSLNLCLIMAQGNTHRLAEALKNGDTQTLQKHLYSQVELSVTGPQLTVSKETAVQKLNHFFTENKPLEFTINHEGKRGDANFLIGMLNTRTGKYRINCFFKKIQNDYFIHQIRIDKIND